MTLLDAVLGPLLMSRIFDVTGSYRAGLLLSPLVALALFSRARSLPPLTSAAAAT